MNLLNHLSFLKILLYLHFKIIFYQKLYFQLLMAFLYEQNHQINLHSNLLILILILKF